MDIFETVECGNDSVNRIRNINVERVKSSSQPTPLAIRGIGERITNAKAR